MSQSRDREQRQVRGRARFKCQVPKCGTFGEQYAHIIPESNGGAYDLSNLILLCYRHHNSWQEPAQAGTVLYSRLTALSTRLRDTPTKDGPLSTLFAWTAGETVQFHLGDGLSFFNNEIILASLDPSKTPYLRLGIDEVGQLVINARFEDETGREILTVRDNEMHVESIDTWDIVVSRRKFTFENSSQKINLSMRQEFDGSVRLTGELHLNGGHYSISDLGILDLINRISLKGNTSTGSTRGLLLSPTDLKW